MCTPRIPGFVELGKWIDLEEALGMWVRLSSVWGLGIGSLLVPTPRRPRAKLKCLKNNNRSSRIDKYISKTENIA